MVYDFKLLKESVKGIQDWLQKEFSSIRTGRATPAVLDSVRVESYGATVGIRELASLGSEDARTLRISPYDTSQMKSIEKAILQSGLGLAVSADDRGLRVIFPELTTERRQACLKVAKDKLEEARRKIRTLRDDVWKDIQGQERAKKLREDDKFRLKDEMQKIVDDASRSFDDLLARKEREINS